jgi:pimeloyl-ACP methyl ester carboxylesterase
VRTQLDDLRAVLHTASQWADVDSTRIALAAWSTGGLAAAMAAAERPNVVAFASLDGATAYAYGDSLLAEVAGSTWRWRTPYLHLVAGVTGPVAQSEHFLSLGCETVAWRSRVAGTQHRHFVSFHGALSPVTDTVATRGIQVWGETLLAFLSQRLQLSGRRALVADSLPLPPCPPSPVNPADARGTPHPA